MTTNNTYNISLKDKYRNCIVFECNDIYKGNTEYFKNIEELHFNQECGNIFYTYLRKWGTTLGTVKVDITELPQFKAFVRTKIPNGIPEHTQILNIIPKYAEIPNIIPKYTEIPNIIHKHIELNIVSERIELNIIHERIELNIIPEHTELILPNSQLSYSDEQLAPQILEESVPQILEESVPQILEESVPQILEELIPQILEKSVPQILEESGPQILEKFQQSSFEDDLNLKSRLVWM